MSGGETIVVEPPAPNGSRDHLLVHTTVSLISAGTERMLVDFGRASLFDKARQQPDKVRQVLAKAKTDGVATTLEAVRSKLFQPLPLGYCNVGVVTEVGSGVEAFTVGDRVVSNGPHADVVKVPKNLCARIPDSVSDDAASFTVVASIGLQGIRLAAPTLGEAFVVTGAGLIGLLTVQLLHAHGCRVLAIDFDESKLALARQYGASTCNPARGEDPVAAGLAFSRGQGVDGVIITASTDSSEPVTQAARMSRKRGRIVLVGVTGLELSRADFYEKELSFQVSCSYGPGRYDPAYETQGRDYPVAFVRWTEQRNFEAVLDMMSCGRLDVEALITYRYAFEDAPKAYQALTGDRSAIGILLTYSAPADMRNIRSVRLADAPLYHGGKPVLGLIGAGNYASRMLIPAFKAAGAAFHSIVTAGGVAQGGKAGFVEATTDVDAMIANPIINTIVIATRHDSHASLVSKALASGRHVFVEKPLAIRLEEIDAVRHAWDAAHRCAGSSGGPHMMVGFNRRFSPQVQKMKALLATVSEPRSFLLTMNAGPIPANHWTQDLECGGGRIIGELIRRFGTIGAAAGSLFVFKGTYRAVLTICPRREAKEKIFISALGGRA
jgi:threonine dehydrogenase-like Zn-dependent dehydrogenase